MLRLNFFYSNEMQRLSVLVLRSKSVFEFFFLQKMLKASSLGKFGTQGKGYW